jgi:hypothetical protein
MFMYFGENVGKYTHYIVIRSFVLLIRYIGTSQRINRMLIRLCLHIAHNLLETYVGDSDGNACVVCIYVRYDTFF